VIADKMIVGEGQVQVVLQALSLLGEAKGLAVETADQMAEVQVDSFHVGGVDGLLKGFQTSLNGLLAAIDDFGGSPGQLGHSDDACGRWQ